jgi:hypothetical protein
MRTRAESSRHYVEPVLIIVIGLALGLVDQTSSEVSGVLRVPALIAALILVGQGLNLLDQARKGDEVDVVTPERVPVGSGGRSAVAEPAPVNRGVDPDADDGSGAGSMAWLVLGLAVWLGLATLAYPTAPLSLILLSLLAAYLLFARGWKLMVPTAPVRR